MANGEYLKDLDETVARWFAAHDPGAGASAPREAAAKYLMSVVGTLMNAAANLAVQVRSEQGLPELDEKHFVLVAREGYQRARRAAKGRKPSSAGGA